jgi:hypothetical protein
MSERFAQSGKHCFHTATSIETLDHATHQNTTSSQEHQATDTWRTPTHKMKIDTSGYIACRWATAAVRSEHTARRRMLRLKLHLFATAVSLLKGTKPSSNHCQKAPYSNACHYPHWQASLPLKQPQCSTRREATSVARRPAVEPNQRPAADGCYYLVHVPAKYSRMRVIVHYGLEEKIVHGKHTNIQPGPSTLDATAKPAVATQHRRVMLE